MDKGTAETFTLEAVCEFFNFVSVVHDPSLGEIVVLFLELKRAVFEMLSFFLVTGGIVTVFLAVGAAFPTAVNLLVTVSCPAFGSLSPEIKS